MGKHRFNSTQRVCALSSIVLTLSNSSHGATSFREHELETPFPCSIPNSLKMQNMSLRSPFLISTQIECSSCSHPFYHFISGRNLEVFLVVFVSFMVGWLIARSS